MASGLRPRAALGGAIAAPTCPEEPSAFDPQPQAAPGAALQAATVHDRLAAEVAGEKRARAPSIRQQRLRDTQKELDKLSSRKAAAAAGGRRKKRAIPSSDHDLARSPKKQKRHRVGQRAAYLSTEYKLGEYEELLKKTTMLERLELRQLVEGGGGDGENVSAAVPASRGCGMTVAELQSLADLCLGSKKAGTINAYRGQVNKLEWFLKYGHTDEICQAWAQSVLRDRLPEQHLDLCCDDGCSMALRALRWAGDNFPGYYEAMNQVNNKPVAISFSTFDGFAAAMNTIYKLQALKSGRANSLPGRIRQFTVVNDAYNGVKCNLVVKGVIDIWSERDPAGTGLDDAISYEDILSFSHDLLMQPHKKASRDRAIMIGAIASASRGETMRNMRLHLFAGTRRLQSVGPCSCLVVPYRSQGEKQHDLAQSDYLGFGVARNVLMCPLFAFALYFMARYTLDAEPFPDINDKEAWRLECVFPSDKSRTTPMSYNTHLNSVNSMMEDNGIATTAKTHVFRKTGAQLLEMAGVSLTTLQKAGHWNQQSVLTKIYMMMIAPEGILAAGGWPGVSGNTYEQFFHPRFMVYATEGIIKCIFPFLEKFKEAVELRRRAKMGCASQIAVLEMFQYLALVFFQGCLDLVQTRRAFDKDGNCVNPCIKRLYQHPDFQMRLEQYRKCLQHNIFESVRPQSTREVLNTVAYRLANIQNLNPNATHKALFPDVVTYDKATAAQLCVQAAEKAVAANASGGAIGGVLGFDANGAPVQPIDREINADDATAEQEEVASLILQEEEQNDLEAFLSPMRLPLAAISPADGLNARTIASPMVLNGGPTESLAQEASISRRALIHDDIGAAAAVVAGAATAVEPATGIATTAKHVVMAGGVSTMQEKDASVSMGALTAKEEELSRKLKALEVENAMLKSKQSVGKGNGNANGVIVQAATKASLLHGLECMVNKTHLESIESELGNVSPQQHVNFAIQRLAATGGLSYNNAVANISARNIGSSVPLSPGPAMVPKPLPSIPLPLHPYGYVNAAAGGAMPTTNVIAAAAAAAAAAVAQAFGGGAQCSFPVDENGGFYSNMDLNMVDAAAYGTGVAPADPYASAGARVRNSQAIELQAAQGQGSLPTSKKEKGKSRYMELQANGRDMPKWQDFTKNIAALVNWCFEPRFEVGGKELSVVELELEPVTGEKDTSWRGPNLRQRASELNSFWQLAKEQLSSKATATCQADMTAAAEKLKQYLGVETVAALMRESSKAIAKRNSASKSTANVSST